MRQQTLRSLFIFNFNKFPFAFIISLLILFSAQLLWTQTSFLKDFFIKYGYLTNKDSIRIDAQLRILKKSNENKKIFIIGGSDAREGIDSDYLNNFFYDNKIDFYNLGISNGFISEWFMLEKKLIDSKPSTIYYLFYPEALNYMPDMDQIRLYFDFSMISYFIEIFSAKIFLNLFGTYFSDFILGEILFLYKYKFAMRKITLNLFQSFIDPNYQKKFSKYIYNISDSKVRLPKHLDELEQRALIKVSKYQPQLKEMFKVFCKNLKLAKINLVIIESPVFPLFKNSLYQNKSYLNLLSFLEKTSYELDFKFINQNQLPKFKKADFIDFYHLNKSGRAKLTNFLSTHLNRL